MNHRVSINDLINYIGCKVEIAGWLYNMRSKGKISFLQIRDGSGRVQAVAIQDQCDKTIYELINKLKMESSLIIEGKVHTDTRAQNGVEIGLTSIRIINNPTDDFPIAKKEHGVDFLLENRHLWIRSERQEAILRIRSHLVATMRHFFEEKAFTLVDTPILTGTLGESSGTLFSLPYFDLGQAYLSQTGQFYLEAASAALGKVYNFGPTFRAEKSKTRRHLTEFWMLEAEISFADNNDNQNLQEKLIMAIVTSVLKNCESELKVLKRNIENLKMIELPFHRVQYSKAIEHLNKLGSKIEWGQDLGAEDETILSNHFNSPIFIINYPTKTKAFYMKREPKDPETVICSDLLAPEGYGEIIGGSQREDDYTNLKNQIIEAGLPLNTYQWYLDLRRYGSVPHSGFGLGLERVVAWITGVRHVRESSAFPRTLSRIYP